MNSEFPISFRKFWKWKLIGCKWECNCFEEILSPLSCIIFDLTNANIHFAVSYFPLGVCLIYEITEQGPHSSILRGQRLEITRT
jgi:hypothetical protein